MGESHESSFIVRLIGKSLVKALDLNPHPMVLSISNLDRLSGRFPVTAFYAYSKPPAGDFSSVVSTIKTSVSRILTFYPPFAGRIMPNQENGELEILCTNEGVELIEALADVPLASLDFYDLDKSVKLVMLPFSNEEVPLRLQVTSYTCGGFSLAWSFDHLLADANSFVKFLTLWSEMARTNQITAVPNHDRWMLRPRSPPTYGAGAGAGASLDRIFTTCTVQDVLACPRYSSIKRLYYVEKLSVDRLRAISSQGGEKRTRTEAVSAHLWKILARFLGESEAIDCCKMGWLVDGRPWVGGERETMSNYVGNLVTMAVGEASSQELKEGSLAHVAGIVSRAIGEVTNEAHFIELIDWIEGHRPGMALAKILLGLGGPTIVVSSCHNMPMMSTDFGFGPPSLWTLYTTLEGMGAGYVNLSPSGRGDGSWLVFAFVWPSLAAELESDPDRVFQPLTAARLGW